MAHIGLRYGAGLRTQARVHSGQHANMHASLRAWVHVHHLHAASTLHPRCIHACCMRAACVLPLCAWVHACPMLCACSIRGTMCSTCMLCALPHACILPTCMCKRCYMCSTRGYTRAAGMLRTYQAHATRMLHGYNSQTKSSSRLLGHN